MPSSRLAASRKAIETARRGLAYLEADVSADRVRLLAALGQARAAAGGYEPAQEALREALNIASQLSDPKLEARLLSARSIVNFHFFRLREAAADGFRSEQLADQKRLPGSAPYSCEFCIRHCYILDARKRR